jgi:hypothetical protein
MPWLRLGDRSATIPCLASRFVVYPHLLTLTLTQFVFPDTQPTAVYPPAAVFPKTFAQTQQFSGGAYPGLYNHAHGPVSPPFLYATASSEVNSKRMRLTYAIVTGIQINLPKRRRGHALPSLPFTIRP